MTGRRPRWRAEQLTAIYPESNNAGQRPDCGKPRARSSVNGQRMWKRDGGSMDPNRFSTGYGNALSTAPPLSASDTGMPSKPSDEEGVWRHHATKTRHPRDDGHQSLAPRVGLEPTTARLTAACSTIELPRNSVLLSSNEVKYTDSRRGRKNFFEKIRRLAPPLRLTAQSTPHLRLRNCLCSASRLCNGAVTTRWGHAAPVLDSCVVHIGVIEGSERDRESPERMHRWRCAFALRQPCEQCGGGASLGSHPSAAAIRWPRLISSTCSHKRIISLEAPAPMRCVMP